MRTKHEQRAKLFAVAIISQFVIAQNAKINRQGDVPSFACGFNGLKIEFFIFWLANYNSFNRD